MAIGVEIDDTAIDPLLLARLRVKTGCKMPDCCVLASAATRNTAVATVRRTAPPARLRSVMSDHVRC